MQRARDRDQFFEAGTSGRLAEAWLCMQISRLLTRIARLLYELITIRDERTALKAVQSQLRRQEQ
jgi:hypothetical protein